LLRCAEPLSDFSKTGKVFWVDRHRESFRLLVPHEQVLVRRDRLDLF
jgi:hypothetical protein